MGRRLALLIATYQYQDTGLRQLTAPAHDAEALAEVLRNPAIAGFEVTMLINEPHYRVGEAIGDFYRDRRSDDLTLLYFTGHGLKDDHGRLHLAMTNTRRDGLLFTAISAEQVDQAMEGCVSRQKVLVLDCCYSGAFPSGGIAKADSAVHTLERFQGRGRTVLTASDATQYSFEGNQAHGQATQSVFTRYLVAGLNDGSADLDGDGDITVDELYSYVHDRVVEEMPQQRPKKQVNVEGRTVIARNINWTLPTYLRNALNSPIANDRLGALEGLAHLYRIGNEIVRSHVRTEVARLADDDSRLVSAAATARLEAMLSLPPGPPREQPSDLKPDAPGPATMPPDVHPRPATALEPKNRGPDRTSPVSSSPPPALPTDRAIPTIGQPPQPTSSITAEPDTLAQPQPDIPPPGAGAAEPDLSAPTGLASTPPAAVPATAGASPHTADQEAPTSTPNRRRRITVYTAAVVLLAAATGLFIPMLGGAVVLLGGIGVWFIVRRPDRSPSPTVETHAPQGSPATTTRGSRPVPRTRRANILTAGTLIVTLLATFALVTRDSADTAETAETGDPTGRELHAFATLHDPDGRGVTSLAFSPDGKLLATATGQIPVRLWDVATRQVTTTLIGSDARVVAFRPDGKTLATNRYGLGLWDVATGKLTTPLTTSAYNVAFSPDGKILATVGDRGPVLWDVATGKATTRLAGSIGWPAFSPDGKSLAVGGAGADHTVWLFDVATGTVTATLTGHTGPVWSVAFSPDGKYLATAGDDSTRLWDVTTRTVTATLNPAADVAFSPDGKTLATAGAGVRLWDVAR